MIRVCRLLLLLSLMSIASTALSAQRVLLVEKIGSPKTKKIFEGQYIEYKLQDDDLWYDGEIMQFRIDQDMIELRDRYVRLDNIEAFRQPQGWSQALGYSLMTFGVSWSGFALIGTLTDGDPTTNYRKGDAIVTGIGLGVGYGLSRLFRYKVQRFGKRRRLRMVDISFK